MHRASVGGPVAFCTELSRTMVHRFLPLLIIAACVGAGSKGTDHAQAPAPPAEQQPPQESYLFSDSLHDIRFLVSTHLSMGGNAECRVEAVNTSVKGSKDVLQHLVLQDRKVMCPMPDGHFQAVEVGDFDFDHVKDFRIIRAAADITIPKYDYWLFDRASNGFVASRELDSIQDPQFDREREMISSQWYAGPGHRGGSTYKVQNGRIVMVSNMEKFTEGDHERWVIWGVKDGKLQPVQEKTMPLPQDH